MAAASCHPQTLAPRNPIMTDPGSFGLIRTEHDTDINIAHALATTTTTSSLIPMILNEQVALPPQGGAGTNLDFGLDSHYVLVLVLEDGRPSISITAVGSRARVRVASMASRSARGALSTPLWLMNPSNPMVTCLPTARLTTLFGRAMAV